MMFRRKLYFLKSIFSSQHGFVSLPLILVLIAIGVISGLFLYSTKMQSKPAISPKRVLMLTASDTQLPAVEGTKQGLSELGYKEGVNIKTELFNPKGNKELTKKMAEEIVVSKPDLIVPYSTTATKAIKEVRGDQNIPVVFIDVGNLKELGLTDLQHPGQFMTGVVSESVSAAAKRMEILKEALPSAKVFAVLINPQNVSFEQVKKIHEETADALGVKVKFYQLSSKEDLVKVLSQIQKDRPSAVMTTQDAVISNNAEMIASALRQSRIPSMDFTVEKAIGAGYLMVFGVHRIDTGRRGARLIDKVLKGEDPGQIPIEFASAQRLQVNSDLATEFGISWPESILLRLGKKSGSN